MDREWVSGRELDEEVADKVMGWKIIYTKELPRNHWPWRRPDGEYTYRVPAYSQDSYDVWDVIDRMRELGLAFHAKGWIKTKDIEVRFSDWYVDGGSPGVVSYGIAPYFPLAVCISALRAVAKLKGELNGSTE